jgi:hypothetical protein
MEWDSIGPYKNQNKFKSLKAKNWLKPNTERLSKN